MNLLVKILSLLSLNSLYWLADYVFYPLMYYIVRYRRRIVRINLCNSFPEKNTNDIKRLEKLYYHHLADVIVEIIYGYRISNEEIQERFQISYSNEVIQSMRQYGGGIGMVGHVGNWEWLGKISGELEKNGIDCTLVYKKLSQQSSDKLMYLIRSRFAKSLCEKNQLLRTIVANRKMSLPQVYCLISDQKPTKNSAQVTINFLNQQTPFFMGAEILAKKFKYPVFLAQVFKTKRGYYSAHIELLTTNPTNTTDGEITLKFAQCLEDNIHQCPELWLWSHNRWRH